MILTFFILRYSYGLSVTNNLTIISLNNELKTKLSRYHDVEILNLPLPYVNQIVTQIHKNT